MPSSTSASPISRMLEIELFLMACLLSRRVMHTLLYYVMLCLWLDLVDMYINSSSCGSINLRLLALVISKVVALTELLHPARQLHHLLGILLPFLLSPPGGLLALMVDHGGKESGRAKDEGGSAIRPIDTPKSGDQKGPPRILRHEVEGSAGDSAHPTLISISALPLLLLLLLHVGISSSSTLDLVVGTTGGIIVGNKD